MTAMTTTDVHNGKGKRNDNCGVASSMAEAARPKSLQRIASAEMQHRNPQPSRSCRCKCQVGRNIVVTPPRAFCSTKTVCHFSWAVLGKEKSAARQQQKDIS